MVYHVFILRFGNSWTVQKFSKVLLVCLENKHKCHGKMNILRCSILLRQCGTGDWEWVNIGHEMRQRSGWKRKKIHVLK